MADDLAQWDAGEREAALRRLDELEAESRERRERLRELLSSVPDAVSRRAVVTSMVTEIDELPQLGLLAKSVALRVARRPARLVRDVQNRSKRQNRSTHS